nr:hypothetical protein [Volvox reticuliferus]
MLLVSALFLLLIWVVKVVFGYWRQMDVRGFPSNNVWGVRAASSEMNWWEAANDRKPADHELADYLDTDGGSNAPVIPAPQCVCLQCGGLIPVPKTCGNCKLATYCSRECQKQHWQRHKPKCARLQQAERERSSRGLPRPPAPPPDPPLQLPMCQLVFSRRDYKELLRVHRAGRQAAATSASSAAVDKIRQGDNAPDHPYPQLQLQPDGGLLSESNDTPLGYGTESREQHNANGQQSASAGSSPPSESVSLSSLSSSPALPASSAATSTSPLSSCSPSQTSHASASRKQQHVDRGASLLKRDGGTGVGQLQHQAERGRALEGCEDAAGFWSWGWSGTPSLALLTPPHPAGIYNTGNSCYAASAIQALLATPGLGEYLRSGTHCGTCTAPEAGEIQGVSSWCPACELSRLAADAAASVATDSLSSSSSSSSSSAAAGQGHRGQAAINGLAGPVPSSSSAWGAAAARVWPWSRPQAAVDGGGLTRQVFRLGRTLMPGRQEDAHELLTKLLEALAEVQLAEAGGRGLLRGIAKRKASELHRQAAAPYANGLGKGSAFPLTPPPPVPMWRGEETSLVHQVLGGYLRRATLCDCCGHVSQSHESVLGLEVNLGSRVSSVEAGLRGYFADEVLDEGNEYRCDRCQQLVCATRRVRLEVAPNALAITLKRFATTGAPAGAWGPKMAKDTRPIALRMDLDLTPFMAPGALDPGPATYRLYGVVQHLGISPPGNGSGFSSAGGSEYPNTGPSYMSMSMHVGHYVAVVRGGDGGWYRCDDDEVTPVGELEVAAITDAYLLFYERIHPYVPLENIPDTGPDQEMEVNGLLQPSIPNGAGRLEQEQQQAGKAEQAERDMEEQQEEGDGEDQVATSGAQASAAEMVPKQCSATTLPAFYPLLPSKQAIQHSDANGVTCAMKAAAAASLETTLVTAVPALPDLSSPTWSAWLGPDTGLPQPSSAAVCTAAGVATVGHGKLAAVGKVAAAVPPVVVRPDFRLVSPRAPLVGDLPLGFLRGQEEPQQVWTLRIWMPGVKSARDVRMAATHAPPPPPQLTAATSAAKERHDAAIAAAWHDAGRVRVWVVGCYSLDVQLGLRKCDMQGGGHTATDQSSVGAGQWQLEVLGGNGCSGQGEAAPLPGVGLEMEVLQPRWRPASSSLYVPLRLRPQPLLASCQ